MCDEGDLARMKGLTRRGFGVLGGAGALAACSTRGTDGGATAGEGMESPSGSLRERAVTIDTPDGEASGFFVHPADGRHPAVLIWPDIAGLRDAFRMMARRLAGEGYAVLVVNPYYRDAAGEQFADFAAFQARDGFQKVGPWRERLTADAVMSDARAFVAWLDGQPAVDTDAGVGVQGYCMGGPFALWSAAALPERIDAAASFHGGGLVRDGAMSPHNLMDRIEAALLIAIAQNDDAKDPQAKATLREAAAAADVPATIEVYPADHGWTVPDSPSYARAEAERAWAALLTLYRQYL